MHDHMFLNKSGMFTSVVPQGVNLLEIREGKLWRARGGKIVNEVEEASIVIANTFKSRLSG